MLSSTRVAERYLASRLLRLGPGRAEARATTTLQKMKKLPARNRGDLQGAMVSAGYHAKKQNKTMFLYCGTSYMHIVWRVSAKPSEYLDPINNTGGIVYSVSPTLEVQAHDVERSVGP